MRYSPATMRAPSFTTPGGHPSEQPDLDTGCRSIQSPGEQPALGLVDH